VHCCGPSIDNSLLRHNIALPRPPREQHYETYISTIQTHAQTPAWISRAHANQRWTCHPGAPTATRSQAPPAKGCRPALRPPHPGVVVRLCPTLRLALRQKALRHQRTNGDHILPSALWTGCSARKKSPEPGSARSPDVTAISAELVVRRCCVSSDLRPLQLRRHHTHPDRFGSDPILRNRFPIGKAFGPVMVLRTDFTGENLFLKCRFIKFADYLPSARNVNDHRLCMVRNRLELIEHFPIADHVPRITFLPPTRAFVEKSQSATRNPKSQTHR